MKIITGGDIINIKQIEIRCKGSFDDGRLCFHKFYVGAPGYDLHGNPLTQIVKCEKCGNYCSVTSVIEESVEVVCLGKEYKDRVP